jgi:ppGpp synthetase/RelA/SpoT-type nucleotidyltranferase
MSDPTDGAHDQKGELTVPAARSSFWDYHSDPMKWTEPTYSGTRRTKAGVALAKGIETPEDLAVIDNWRSSHALPLQTIKMMLKGRATSIDQTAVVAQRLKRLPSIRAKLQRETMRLQQMQDLGGCRAIVRDMKVLKRLSVKFTESLEKDPKRPDIRRHRLIEYKDYIAEPKADGYRSLHHVFEYRTNTPHLQCFSGHLIEVQMRTQLQHAWATAVEIVDTFTGQSLKSALRTQIGDPDWRRFFALISSIFSLKEDSPLVPDTISDPNELRGELRALSDRIQVVDVLGGLSTVVYTTSNRKASARAYVLKLNTRERKVTIIPFDRERDAQLRLFDEEKNSADDPAIQVVQVSVEQMQALKTAYPNYYLDTSKFINELNLAIAPTKGKNGSAVRVRRLLRRKVRLGKKARTT